MKRSSHSQHGHSDEPYSYPYHQNQNRDNPIAPSAATTKYLPPIDAEEEDDDMPAGILLDDMPPGILIDDSLPISLPMPMSPLLSVDIPTYQHNADANLSTETSIDHETDGIGDYSPALTFNYTFLSDMSLVSGTNKQRAGSSAGLGAGAGSTHGANMGADLHAGLGSWDASTVSANSNSNTDFSGATIPPPTPYSHIPRPPNAFILFRSAFIRSRKISPSIEGNHSTLSKIIGQLWRGLPLLERKEWEEKAKIAQEEHRMRYPDWRFKPAGSGSGGKSNRGRGKGRGRGRGRGRLKAGAGEIGSELDPGDAYEGSSMNNRDQDQDLAGGEGISTQGPGRKTGAQIIISIPPSSPALIPSGFNHPPHAASVDQAHRPYESETIEKTNTNHVYSLDKNNASSNNNDVAEDRPSVPPTPFSSSATIVTDVGRARISRASLRHKSTTSQLEPNIPSFTADTNDESNANHTVAGGTQSASNAIMTRSRARKIRPPELPTALSVPIDKQPRHQHSTSSISGLVSVEQSDSDTNDSHNSPAGHAIIAASCSPATGIVGHSSNYDGSEKTDGSRSELRAGNEAIDESDADNDISRDRGHKKYSAESKGKGKAKGPEQQRDRNQNWSPDRSRENISLVTVKNETVEPTSSAEARVHAIADMLAQGYEGVALEVAVREWERAVAEKEKKRRRERRKSRSKINRDGNADIDGTKGGVDAINAATEVREMKQHQVKQAMEDDPVALHVDEQQHAQDEQVRTARLSQGQGQSNREEIDLGRGRKLYPSSNFTFGVHSEERVSSYPSFSFGERREPFELLYGTVVSHSPENRLEGGELPNSSRSSSSNETERERGRAGGEWGMLGDSDQSTTMFGAFTKREPEIAHHPDAATHLSPASIPLTRTFLKRSLSEPAAPRPTRPRLQMMPEFDPTEGSNGYDGSSESYQHQPQLDCHSPIEGPSSGIRYPKPNIFPIPGTGSGYPSFPNPYSTTESWDFDTSVQPVVSTSGGWVDANRANIYPSPDTESSHSTHMHSPASPPPSAISPSDFSMGFSASVDAMPDTYSSASVSSSSSRAPFSTTISSNSLSGDHNSYGDRRSLPIRGRRGSGSPTRHRSTLSAASHSAPSPFLSVKPPSDRRRAWTTRSTPTPQDTPALQMFPRYQGNLNTSSESTYGHTHRPESRASPPPLSPASPAGDFQSYTVPKHKRTLTWGEHWSYLSTRSSASPSSSSSPTPSSPAPDLVMSDNLHLRLEDRAAIGPGVTWQQVETDRRREFAAFGMDYEQQGGERTAGRVQKKAEEVDMAQLISTENMGWQQLPPEVRNTNASVIGMDRSLSWPARVMPAQESIGTGIRKIKDSSQADQSITSSTLGVPWMLASSGHTGYVASILDPHLQTGSDQLMTYESPTKEYQLLDLSRSSFDQQHPESSMSSSLHPQPPPSFSQSQSQFPASSYSTLSGWAGAAGDGNSTDHLGAVGQPVMTISRPGASHSVGHDFSPSSALKFLQDHRE